MITGTRAVAAARAFVVAHKAVSAVALIAAVAAGYWVFGASGSGGADVRYVAATVAKGTIVISVSATGQVSALNQIDVKPKKSGEVVYVGVKNGDAVRSGALLVQLDTRDAARAIGDAQISLDQTKLNLEKMKGLATDEGTIRGDRKKAEGDLAKAYEDGFNTVANAFLDLPSVMAGLQDVLYANTLGSGGQWNIDYYANAIQSAVGERSNEGLRFRDGADAAYHAARAAYDRNFADYKAASRFSSTDVIERLVGQTHETTKLIAEAVKSTNNLVQLYKDRLTERGMGTKALADTHLTQLTSYTGKTNSYLANLLSVKTTIQNDKEAIINVGFNIADQEIRVAQAERALTDARQALADCYIRAPFAGTVAKVNVKRGDTVSAGTAVVTVITAERIAKITLNEVDVAKVKVGQKATLTFDAVPDVSVAGAVADVETIGTASQGVVSYGVEIAFADSDARVKPGMSVSASIVTDVRQDVLMVPNGAVKSRSGAYYVEVLEGGIPEGGGGAAGFVPSVPPRAQSVEAGVANDSDTEIVSGLKEGDAVVVRTVTSNQQTGTTATGLFGGGGGVRIPR